MTNLLKEFVQLCVETKWWQDPALRDQDSPNYMANEVRWEKMAEDPEYKALIDAVKNAADPKELSKAKRAAMKLMDGGQSDLPDGVLSYFVDKKKEELSKMSYTPRSSADARTDAILRTRDSSGRAKARRRS